MNIDESKFQKRRKDEDKARGIPDVHGFNVRNLLKHISQVIRI